jgi:RimJ/RimL family protein N-acetyltransferase
MPRLNNISISLKEFKFYHITKKYISWLNNPILMKFSRHKNKVFNKIIAKKYLDSFNKSKNLFLIIKCNKKKRVIGTMTVYFFKRKKINIASIGILIGDKIYLNKGYGTASLKKLIKFLSKKKNIKKIIIGTNKNNIPMINIAKNNMFRLLRLNKKIIFFHKILF